MMGRHAETADFFQRALTLDESNHSAWSNLGSTRHFLGRYAEAARALEKAVGLAPDRHLYRGNLGDAYRRLEGRQHQAVKAYENGIRLVRERLSAAPDDGLRSSLAVYLAKSGDKAAALAELAQVDHVQAKDSRVLFKAAPVYEFAGDRLKALTAVKRAIRAGYSRHEIVSEPDWAALRSDPRYARIADSTAAARN